MRKHPAEEPILRLVKDGLGDQEIAERVGVGSNFVWAVRAASGIRPVSEKQLEIARRIVARKRAAQPTRKMAATPGPKTAAKSRARRSSK
jgi:hypothetical protein